MKKKSKKALNCREKVLYSNQRIVRFWNIGFCVKAEPVVPELKILCKKEFPECCENGFVSVAAAIKKVSAW